MFTCPPQLQIPTKLLHKNKKKLPKNRQRINLLQFPLKLSLMSHNHSLSLNILLLKLSWLIFDIIKSSKYMVTSACVCRAFSVMFFSFLVSAVIKSFLFQTRIQACRWLRTSRNLRTWSAVAVNSPNKPEPIYITLFCAIRQYYPCRKDTVVLHFPLNASQTTTEITHIMLKPIILYLHHKWE